MAADDIWALTGKKLSGEASPEDLQELESILANNESNRRVLLNLEQMWLISNTQTTPNPAEDIDKRWEKFRQKLMPAPLKKQLKLLPDNKK